MAWDKDMKAKGEGAGKTDPEQSARFIEAARELGCEENFVQFEEALKRIVRAKPPQTLGVRKVARQSSRSPVSFPPEGMTMEYEFEHDEAGMKIIARKLVSIDEI